MATPFLGEVKINPWSFAPKGWASCNGALLPINQNQALFSLLGTTYGGNGTTTFAIPDLRSRVPMHVGNGLVLGQHAGEENHTLVVAEMPAHVHGLQASSGAANAPGPGGNILATGSGISPYTKLAPDTTLVSGTIGSSGSSQPHTNLQPYLALNYIIALQGIYPSRN